MTRITAKTLRDIRTVDWDFPVHFSGSSRTIHWYPGTFPSELPATVIQAFSDINDVVFDPYAGAGTTGAEALRFGRRALMVESNPIGAASSYVVAGLILLKAYRPELVFPAIEAVEIALSRAFKRPGTYPLFALNQWYQREIDRCLAKLMWPTPDTFLPQLVFGPPHWRLLRPWYEQRTLSRLRRTMQNFMTNQEGAFCRLLGVLGGSAIMRAASSQTRSWGHIADNVLPPSLEEKDVLALFSQWLGRARGMVQAIEMMEHSRGHGRRAAVLFGDWSVKSTMRNPLRERARLLVSSPPYANAIDYTLAQRLSLYLLGATDKAIEGMVTNEFGARRKRFSSTAECDWSKQLADTLSAQLRLVDDEGYVVLVLPHRDAGRNGASECLDQVLGDSGWNQLLAIDRSIRQSRTRQSWTSIKKETLYFYGATKREVEI